MDLKEFIKQTISGIVDATSELQASYERQGVIINPPVNSQGNNLYREDSMAYTLRRIETIEFDVAITVESETSGGGKAGLRIFAAEAGAEAKHARRGEEVSRVRFSIPLVFAPSFAEKANRFEFEQEQQRRQRDQESPQEPYIDL